MADAIVRRGVVPGAGNRTELTAELAGELIQACHSCPDLETVARLCMVEPARLQGWLKEGQQPGAAPLFR